MVITVVLLHHRSGYKYFKTFYTQHAHTLRQNLYKSLSHYDRFSVLTQRIVHYLEHLNIEFDYVIFSWVIDENCIYEEIFSKLKKYHHDLLKLTLVCSEEELKNRIQRDDQTVNPNSSIEKLKKCSMLDTIKVNTTGLSPNQVVANIKTILTEKDV